MPANMIQRSIIGILSLLIVFFATCGNTHTSPYLNNTDTVATPDSASTKNQEDQEGDQEVFKLVAYEAVLPLLQANFLPLQYTVFKVAIQIVNTVEEERTFPLPFISYFNTLFRLIISPNAP